MFGKRPCAVCLEKDLRISDLKSQIESLEKLVFPKKLAQDLSTTDLEVDTLFDPPSPSIENNDAISIDREAQLLLSGDYDGIHGEV